MSLPLADFTISPNQIILLASGAILIFTIRRWRQLTLQKQQHSTKAPLRMSTPTSPLSVREVSTELSALLAELEETSRRLTAQLDNRYTRLEQLLVEADSRIAHLERLAAPAPTTQTAPNFQPTARPNPPAAVSEAQQMLQRLRAERGAPAPADDPAYTPIYALADQGKSPREIAQHLNRQPGEIELILALRPRSMVG